jgi:hypothetical protein
MRNKILGFLLASGLLASFTVSAQSETDALRYGELSSGATARSIGLGGAGGSYGGDFSSLSINPAGLGVYRNSEVMITPSLHFNKMTSTYLTHQDGNDNAKLTLNNLGIVLAGAAKGSEYEKSDWKSFSLGLGYNRLADFNSAGRFSGPNSKSSFSDMLSADAVAYGVEQNIVPPYGFFGYQGFLLYSNDYSSIPHHTILDKGGALNQTKTWDSKGGVDEWTISLGGNYKEKLLLGATLGLVSYKFDRNTNFKETDNTGDPDNDFDYSSFNETLSTTGFGFNLKLGAIYVVNDMFRVGAAVHTPTWSSFKDLMDYDLTTNTENLKSRTAQADNDPTTFVQPTAPYEYDYSLRTPWRGVLSATVFLGHNGFITADYEYVDYASMKYSFDPQDIDFENSVNKAIKDTYTGGHNLRIGIEGKKDNFFGRLGFAYHTSPFQRVNDFGGQSMDISAGIGARFNAFFLDLGYMHSFIKQSEYGYPLLNTGVPVGIADLKYDNNIIALTAGFKF